jgi:hypothetical protein
MNKPIQLQGQAWSENRSNFDRNLAVTIGIDRFSSSR